MGQLSGTSAEVIRTEAGYFFPEIHPRLQWAGNLAMDIGAGADVVAEKAGRIKGVASAVGEDIKSGSFADKCWILGATAFFALNSTQARQGATKYGELVAFQHSGPVTAAAIGIITHPLWYGAFGEVFSQGVRRSKKSIQALNENFSLDEIELPGLEPGSLEVPDEIEGRVRRTGSWLWRRGQRLAVSKAGMSLYIAAGEAQDQSTEEQNTQRWGIVKDGTYWAVVKSTLFAAGLAGFSKADPELAGAFINIAKRPELIPVWSYGPLAWVAFQQRRKQHAELAEVNGLPQPETLPSDTTDLATAV